MTDSLQPKIERWLASQGYPLEMAVAASCFHPGFRVAQGQYFLDPISEKSREIDVLASREQYQGAAGMEGYIVCECKTTSDKPWVLLGGGSVPALKDRALTLMRNESGWKFLTMVRKFEDVQGLPLFARVDVVSHGIVRALTQGNEDVAFNGVASVANAGVGSLAFAYDMDRHECTIGIALPVLILDGPLYRYSLGDDRKPTLLRVHHGLLPVADQRLKQSRALVWVITREVHEEFLKGAFETFDFLLDQCLEVNADVVKRWKPSSDK